MFFSLGRIGLTLITLLGCNILVKGYLILLLNLYDILLHRNTQLFLTTQYTFIFIYCLNIFDLPFDGFYIYFQIDNLSCWCNTSYEDIHACFPSYLFSSFFERQMQMRKWRFDVIQFIRHVVFTQNPPEKKFFLFYF